ncbi:hypothetical protein psal_cds_1202 [Pandoravirus salinus]|uniref:Uncharacterized protein n=1 Tax=Pandoravirus salinus TaxID=1349410 RepID=S4VXW9_9VIRU|nr:hypothetical protein psal_cds_1202 [Pandoravirus salinus]AGO85499.1 hypothetical protein psal_cds_1202 [Pandoravirus salinus]
MDVDNDAPSPCAVQGAICDGRSHVSAARIDDEGEKARLLAGSMVSATARQRLASARHASHDSVLASEYRALWAALAADDDARKAMDGCPNPTSVQVAARYGVARPDSVAHMAAWDALATTDPESAVTHLVEALGTAVRQDENSTAQFGQTHGTSYYVLTSQKESVIRAALFALPEREDGVARIVYCVDSSADSTCIDRNVVKNKWHEGPVAWRSPTVPLYMLMCAFADRASDDNAHVAHWSENRQAHAWFTQSLVRLDSPRRVPDTVRRYIDEQHQSYRWRGLFAGEWFGGAICGVRLAEERIDAILCLIAGRQWASRAVSVFAQPGSLLDRAAAAYRGPLCAGVLPVDVLARTAAYAWHRVCTETPLAPGRLPHGHALVDIARAFDVEPTRAQLERPELLCVRLAEPAVAVMVRSRYGVEPVRGPFLYAGDHEFHRLWRALCDQAPGTRPGVKTLHVVHCHAARNRIALGADDEADTQRLYARLAVFAAQPYMW